MATDSGGSACGTYRATQGMSQRASLTLLQGTWKHPFPPCNIPRTALWSQRPLTSSQTEARLLGPLSNILSNSVRALHVKGSYG